MTKIYFVILFAFLLCTITAQDKTDWSGYIEMYNEKGVNTDKTEFSPTKWNEQVVFVRTSNKTKLVDKNTKEPYFDLMVSDINKARSLENAKPLPSTINSDYHEGPASFSENGETIYFTRVDYSQGQFGQSKNNQVALKIFSSTIINGSWTSPIKMDFNEDNVAMAHPSFSYDGDYMIFASDRPGGYGKMDLYITYSESDGWSEPINLGEKVNSSGNDWFPHINKRGYLFFASDGQANSEGLDVYITELAGEIATLPQKLPYPINTKHDDFGLTIDANGINGYMTSNRPDGLGKDDIYGFNSLVSLFSCYDSDYNKVKLTISDGNSTKAISGARVRFKRLENKEFETFDQKIFKIDNSEEVDSVVTDEKGFVQYIIEEGYTLIDVTHPGKQNWTLVISNHGSKKDINVVLKDLEPTIEAEPKVIYIKEQVPAPPSINNVKVDVGAVIVFENIYYDYNSSKLTQGAKRELDVLAELMLTNPNLKIQLSAHTDSRGDVDYNQELSQQRANSAKEYLISKGIPYQNVQAIGYGETQLRNHCKDDVYCSEAEHIYNRRTEVKILQK